MDKVRRGEHKRLVAQGDERLCGTRHAWLYHPDELMARSPDPARDEAFEALAFSNLQTAEAEEGTSVVRQADCILSSFPLVKIPFSSKPASVLH